MKYKFRPPTKKATPTNENFTVWTTNFPNLLKLTEREKQLNSNAKVAYKRPQTLSTLLTNFKIIAHKVNVGRGISHPCCNCMLCDQRRRNDKTNRLHKIKNRKNSKVKTAFKL